MRHHSMPRMIAADRFLVRRILTGNATISIDTIMIREDVINCTFLQKLFSVLNF